MSTAAVSSWRASGPRAMPCELRKSWRADVHSGRVFLEGERPVSHALRTPQNTVDWLQSRHAVRKEKDTARSGDQAYLTPRRHWGERAGIANVDLMRYNLGKTLFPRQRII